MSAPLKPPIVHGTYAGWNQHQKRGEQPCSACKDASTQYMRDYRARPGQRHKDRWWNSTRKRALEMLAREYPARFLEILDKVRADASGEP